MTQASKWVAVDFGGPEVLRMIDVDVPDPGPGQVRIDVRAVGMNPADAKHIAPGQDRKLLPLPLGYEVAGIVSALGPDTRLASGGGEVGDEVVASQVTGGYTTAITVPASSVFAKPPALTFPEAANLLLVGTTAADVLHVSGAREGEIVLLHGAAGAVGVSVLQQARQLGVRVVGTASPASFGFVRRFGGTPVEYGPGLLDRVRAAAPEGIAAALDTAGSERPATSRSLWSPTGSGSSRSPPPHGRKPRVRLRRRVEPGERAIPGRGAQPDPEAGARRRPRGTDGADVQLRRRPDCIRHADQPASARQARPGQRTLRRGHGDGDYLGSTGARHIGGKVAEATTVNAGYDVVVTNSQGPGVAQRGPPGSSAGYGLAGSPTRPRDGRLSQPGARGGCRAR